MTFEELHHWYRTPLGHHVRKALQTVFDDTLAELKGKRVLIVGYGLPFLHLWHKQAQVFIAMPGKLGAMAWPAHASRTCLAWEESLPFPENSFDAIVLIHSLENANHPGSTLRCCNTLLKADGNLVVMVPNRRSIWCRFENTPFGSGHPYSKAQLTTLLQKNAFCVNKSNSALYFSPFKWGLRWRDRWERIGRKFSLSIGGVLILSAKKDILSGSVVLGHEKGRKRIIFARPC